MTQQLTMDGLDGIGRVIPTDLQAEMQQSYLEYAMSVIVGRALPDIRDGLKPVHRRILYAMHELGLTPDRPFRKCARVVGDVLGKYHPHGDQAVYDALVRMVQEFSSRYPLVAGHGNFGSVDNDPPAAMRYTECRLAGIGNTGLLAEISEENVDFVPNFDGSQAEPSILPARLPLLLLNGSSGIAVGMATNIPPHNLNEVVDGLLCLIDCPQATVADLMAKIPAPDFPTGGYILNTQGIEDMYTHGRGGITLQGVAQYEEIPATKGRHRRTAIIITEFPFQVNKASWIEKVADLVTQEKITGIADLRDESDRAGIRVVVELRKDAHPQQVLQQLFKQTSLQTTFGAILLAVIDGKPQQVGLKDLLQHFLAFREQTLTRIFTAELAHVRQKAEEVAGMLLALSRLDAVIDLLRHAPDGSTAKLQLQTLLDCSPQQADTILAMPLRRLTGLEQDRLHKEHQAHSTRIRDLEGLLQDRQKRLNYLKKELRQLKKEFGDPRRSRIKAAEGIPLPEQSLDLEEESETLVLLQLTQKGYIRRSPLPKRGRIKPPAGDTIQTHCVGLHQNILVLTTSGKGFPLSVDSIPTGRGAPLITLVSGSESGVASLLLEQAGDLILLSRQGRIKRIPPKDFSGLTSRGSTMMKLKEGDELGWAEFYISETPGQALIIATASGRLLRLDPIQIPRISKTAQGQPAIRLQKQDTVVGMSLGSVNVNSVLGLITQQGYGKQIPVTNIPQGEQGGLGIQGISFQSETDQLAGILLKKQSDDFLITTSSTVFSVPWSQLPHRPKGEAGDPIFPGDRIQGDRIQGVYPG
jgi:DNA gyrase subunit A